QMIAPDSSIGRSVGASAGRAWVAPAAAVRQSASRASSSPMSRYGRPLPSVMARRPAASSMAAQVPCAVFTVTSRMWSGLSRFAALVIEAERAQRGIVGEREENRGLVRRVEMFVYSPARQRERVALLPVDALAVDDGGAAAAHDVIDRTGRMAMGVGGEDRKSGV